MWILVVGAGALAAVRPLECEASAASFCEAEFHCMKSREVTVAVDEAS